MEKAMNHNRNCSGCPEQVSYNCKEHPAYKRSAVPLSGFFRRQPLARRPGIHPGIIRPYVL